MTAPIVTNPTWLARNEKAIWAAAGLVLAVLTDVVDWQLQVIPIAWLPALHFVILALTTAGVQRVTNVQGVEEVLNLVAKVLPNHQLVPVTPTVVAPAVPAPTTPGTPPVFTMSPVPTAPSTP